MSRDNGNISLLLLGFGAGPLHCEKLYLWLVNNNHIITILLAPLGVSLNY